jgi:DNA-binding transcriptional LysR family regulator
MDRLAQLEMFVAVAEAGGFARAAARLRASPPAVTRAVAALERRLGAQLFTRTTRVVRLTEAGRQFLERARRLLADLDDAERELMGEAGVAAGRLKVTAPATMGRAVLLPVVAGFLRSHPRMSVELVLLDRVVNLIEEGIDAGLRVGQLPDSSLIALRLGEVRRVLVASKAYLARRGRPMAPADLKHHAMIAFTGLQPAREFGVGGSKRAGRETSAPRLKVNDALAAIAAAEAGEGIAEALSYMVAKQIRSGRLAAVLQEFAPASIPVQLVYPESRIVGPGLRAFLDFAAPRLRKQLRALALPVRRPA